MALDGRAGGTWEEALVARPLSAQGQQKGPVEGGAEWGFLHHPFPSAICTEHLLLCPALELRGWVRHHPKLSFWGGSW